MNLKDYTIYVIAMIIFDCIIGNTDRHSENWAFLQNNLRLAEQWEKLMSELSFLRRLWINYWVIKRKTNYTSSQVKRLFARTTYSFSPFFDNGSSLGRELTEHKISKMLDDENVFNSYFNKGYHDIRLRNKKTTFRDTLDILCCDYKGFFEKIMIQNISRFKSNEFQEIIENRFSIAISFVRYKKTVYNKTGYCKN